MVSSTCWTRAAAMGPLSTISGTPKGGRGWGGGYRTVSLGYTVPKVATSSLKNVDLDPLFGFCSETAAACLKNVDQCSVSFRKPLQILHMKIRIHCLETVLKPLHVLEPDFKYVDPDSSCSESWNNCRSVLQAEQSWTGERTHRDLHRRCRQVQDYTIKKQSWALATIVATLWQLLFVALLLYKV